jgi:hypothetical protein
MASGKQEGGAVLHDSKKETKKSGAKKAAAAAAAGDVPASEEGKTDALERIWSRRMALVGLKRIYLAALEGARVEVRDRDGVLVEVKFSPTAAAAATKAIEVANKMLGYTSPEESEGDTHLTVELAEAGALAK